jgi:hypothetical protein
MRLQKNVVNTFAVLFVSILLAGCGSTKTTSKSQAAPIKNATKQ